MMSQRVCNTVMPSGSFEVNTVNGFNDHSRDTVPNEIINIPVVVHIVYKTSAQNITDAEVLSQIAVLNQDFRLKAAGVLNIPLAFKGFAADARINFCLAQVDPTGHTTKGIVRKYTNNDYFLDDAIKFSAQGGDNAWDSKKYLNIWVCYLFGRSLGYSSIPGGPADKDGVVITTDVFGTIAPLRTPFDKGRTATHEIGHWLGLKHLWGDEDCGSDDVDDTPSQRFSNYYCPAFPHVTTCSPNANGDMFMNFMDFTDDACMSMFTQGQKAKMRGLFALNGPRNSFLNSFACDSSLATGGPLPSDTTINEVKPTAADEINIYPNPAREIINIRAKNILTLKGKTAKLVTITGKLVKRQTLLSNVERIDVSQLLPGIYFLKIGEGNTSKVFKIIKL
ncbi:MAG: M43 family zinc metalloprotease [Ferruginibacter sp.]